MDWIIDKQPKRSGTYLVTVLANFGYNIVKERTSIAYFDKGEWTCNPDKVVAWQELPQPFKVSEKKKKIAGLKCMNEKAKEFKEPINKDKWIEEKELYSITDIVSSDWTYYQVATKFANLFIAD